MEAAKSRDPDTPILQKLEPGLFYSISGSETQTLQILLERTKKIVTEAQNITWLSNKVKIIPKLSGFQRLLQPSPLSNIVDVVNDTNDPGVVGVGINNRHGPICVIKSENTSSAIFYCNRTNFLLCTASVEVSMATLPRNLQNRLLFNLMPNPIQFWHKCKFSSNDMMGGIFLQSTGPILEKTLNFGESFYIALASIVAIQDTCPITENSIFSIPAGSPALYIPKRMVLIEGPGLIYYSSSNEVKSQIRGSEALNNMSSYGMVLYFITALVSLLVVLISFSKIAVEIELQDQNAV